MSNIVLIGMPGSGKSTLGKRLAREINMPFIDTDSLLEAHENMHIQDIVNRRGVAHLRKIEDQVLSAIDLDQHVISTGGSAVYSQAAMQHLGSIGVRLYLKISLPTLLRRVDNEASRGLAKMKSHPLPRLYSERIDLYAQAADITFDNDWPVTALSMDGLLKQLRAMPLNPLDSAVQPTRCANG